MANYFFQKEIMASTDVRSYLQPIKYEVSATPTVVTNGALVTVTDPCTNIWGTNDLNCYKATAPAADTDPIHIVDLLETPYLENTAGTKMYRVGEEIISLQAPADFPVRSKKPKLDDRFLVGADLFASAPTVGQYAIPTAGATTYTPSATKVTTKFCVKIVESVTKGYGVEGSIVVYRCRVVTEV
jgi:hypothetical protein